LYYSIIRAQDLSIYRKAIRTSDRRLPPTSRCLGTQSYPDATSGLSSPDATSGLLSPDATSGLSSPDTHYSDKLIEEEIFVVWNTEKATRLDKDTSGSDHEVIVWEVLGQGAVGGVSKDTTGWDISG